MRDGVKLYGDLYRPVRSGKFPVLMYEHHTAFSARAFMKP